MIDIFHNENIDFQTFLNLAKKNNIFINENLFIKKISENNHGFFSKDKINANQKILSIPKNLLISRDLIKNFIFENKIDYISDELLKLWFCSLPKIEYFKKNNIIFLDETKKKILLNFFIEQSPTRRKIISLFDYTNQLDDVDLFLFLIFRSRSFRINNTSYLIPVLDMVNYKKDELNAITNTKEVYYKIKKNFNENEEFFQGYNSQHDIVSFYMRYNFVPENFNLISIPPNFFSINIPKNLHFDFDTSYWNFKNGRLSNKLYIVFNNLEIPLEFRIEISKIIPDRVLVTQITKTVLELMKNEVNFNELNSYLEKESKASPLFEFARALSLNHSMICKAIKMLE
jgi:hypothetical protein